MNISLFPFAPEELVSRDGFSRPVLRQTAHFPRSGYRLTHHLVQAAICNVKLKKLMYKQYQLYNTIYTITDSLHRTCRNKPTILSRDTTRVVVQPEALEPDNCKTVIGRRSATSASGRTPPCIIYNSFKIKSSVCVCFLPIHSGHQVRWTYQPGSHRREVTQDFSSTFFLRCVP